MIEDRELTREVTLHCNNVEYKTVKEVAAVQLRWNSDVPEVAANPLGFVRATSWKLTPSENARIMDRVDDSADMEIIRAQLAAVTKERDEHKIGFDVMFRYLELDVIPEAARAVAEAIDKHRAAALQGDGT